MRHYEQMIYDIIYKAPRHLTTEDIFLELKTQEPKVVLATVYNNLKVLYQKKLIHKVTIEGMPDRYDKTERHDHLICSKCGKISDVKFTNLTQQLQKQLGLDILSYDLNINYICPVCKEK